MWIAERGLYRKMATNSRKKRLNNPKDTLQEALEECNDLLLKMKKPKKKSRFKFFRDPLTGRRKSHYPYRPRFQEDCDPCSTSSVNGKLCTFVNLYIYSFIV